MKRGATASALGLGLWMACGQALAQTDDSALASTYSSTSTSTTSSSMTTGGIILTVYGLTPKQRAQLLQHYMEHQRAQLGQDLAAGGGQAVEDLAQLFEVPPGQRAAFGAMLRAQRAALMRQVGQEGGVSEQAALTFARHIHQGMLSRPDLRALAQGRQAL